MQQISSLSLRLKNEVLHQSKAYYRTRRPRGTNFLGEVVKYDVAPVVDPPAGTERFVYNRNPRNLERLGIAYKNDGWSLDKKGRAYYHKLVISEGHKEIKVSCIHNSGKIAVSVSSNEWAIRKLLYQPTDKCACINIGRIFAQRCLQSGLMEMEQMETYTDGKLKLMVDEITNNGIMLSEPKLLRLRSVKTKVEPPRPWNVVEE